MQIIHPFFFAECNKTKLVNENKHRDMQSAAGHYAKQHKKRLHIYNFKVNIGPFKVNIGPFTKLVAGL